MAGKKTDNNQPPHKGHRERLRRRVEKDPNLDTFEDHEILEYILSCMLPRKDTNVLAHNLINRFGSLDGVFTASYDELVKVKNMTRVSSLFVATFNSIARQTFIRNIKNHGSKSLNTPQWCVDHFTRYFISRNTECFCLLLMDINFNELQTYFYEGTSGNSITIDTTELMMRAVRKGAVYAAIAHNHPSGDVSPTMADVDFTQDLLEKLASMKIELVDHFILSCDKVFSFRRNQIMEHLIRRINKLNADKLQDVTRIFKEIVNPDAKEAKVDENPVADFKLIESQDNIKPNKPARRGRPPKARIPKPEIRGNIFEANTDVKSVTVSEDTAMVKHIEKSSEVAATKDGDAMKKSYGKNRIIEVIGYNFIEDMPKTSKFGDDENNF